MTAHIFILGSTFQLDWDGRCIARVVDIKGDEVTIARGDGNKDEDFYILKAYELTNWIHNTDGDAS